MNFTTFNNANNYLQANVAITKKSYMEAAAAFFKAGDHIGHYQAYVRAHPGQLKGLVEGIWNGKPGPLAGAPLIAHLALQTDTLWRNTVKAQGEMQRTAERIAREQYWTTGLGVGECPDLETYAKHGISANALADFKISKIQLLDYVSLLEALTAGHVAETDYNKYNQSHKQALTLREVAPVIRTANDGELLDTDGSYKKNGEKWARLIACANYWIREIPAHHARANARTQILNWVPGGPGDVLKRLVSVGERDNVMAKGKVLSQGPTSYERHKWFFFGTGAPGVGHACTLTITLKGRGIDFLMGMAQQVSDDSQKTSPHAFLRKENERDCIGIHEELLDVFCTTMIASITAK